MKKTLEVRNLSKYHFDKYGVNKVVDNVSFDLLEGEILGIIGQTGSGKSEIGKSLIRSIDDVCGTIVVGDKVISSPKVSNSTLKSLRKSIQFISHDSSEIIKDEQRVYDILSESVAASDLLKVRATQFWNNWNEFSNVFTNSAQISNKTDFADLLNLKKNLIIKYYDDLDSFIDSYSYDNSHSFKDNIDALISKRYTSKFNIYNELTNDLIDYELRQISKIAEYREKFNKRDFETVFVDYINAIDNLNKYDETRERSDEYQKKLHALNIERNKEIKLLKQETAFNISAIKNDLKIRINFHKTLADNSTVFESFETSYLRSAAIKLQLKVFRKIPKRVSVLTAEQIIELTSEISDLISQTTKVLIDKLRSEEKNIITKLDSDETLKQFKVNLDDAKQNFEIANKNPDDIQTIKNSKKTFDRAQSNYDNKAMKLAKAEFQQRKKLAKQVVSQLNVNVFDFNKYIEYSKENILVVRDEHATIIQNEKDLEKNKPEFSKRIRRSLIVKINQAKVFKDELIQSGKVSFESESNALDGEIKLLQGFFWSSEWNTKQKSVVSKFRALVKNITESAKVNGVHKNEIKKFKSSLNELEKKTMQLQIELDTLAKRTHSLNDVFNLKKINKNKRTKFANQIELDNQVFTTLKEVEFSVGSTFKRVSELNDVQKLKVLLSRALIVEPQIIVADEPTFDLDSTTQKHFISILKQIIKSRNISMIYLGSDVSTLEFISDNALVMHFGKIIEFGDSGQVFKKPAHIYTKSLIESIPKLSNNSESFIQFENINSYIHEFTVDNQPRYHRVSNEHFVFCTNEQLKRWENENIIKIMADKNDNVTIVEDNMTAVDFDNNSLTKEITLDEATQIINDDITSNEMHEVRVNNIDIIASTYMEIDDTPLATEKITSNEEITWENLTSQSNEVEETVKVEEDVFQVFDTSDAIDEAQIGISDDAVENYIDSEQIVFSDIEPLTEEEVSRIQNQDHNAIIIKDEQVEENTLESETDHNVDEAIVENVIDTSQNEDISNDGNEFASNSQQNSEIDTWLSQPISDVVSEEVIEQVPKPIKIAKDKTQKIAKSKEPIRKKVAVIEKKKTKVKTPIKQTPVDNDTEVLPQYVEKDENKPKTKISKNQQEPKNTKKDKPSNTNKTSKTKSTDENVKSHESLKLKSVSKSKSRNNDRIYSDTNEKIIFEKGMRMPKKVRDTKHENFDLPQFKVDYSNANKIIESTFEQNVVIDDSDTFENDIEEIQVIKSATIPTKSYVKPPRPNRVNFNQRNRNIGNTTEISKASRNDEEKSSSTGVSLNLDGYFIDKSDKE